jgi:hypothetical protein
MDVFEPVFGFIGEVATQMLGEVAMEFFGALVRGEFTAEVVPVAPEDENPEWVKSASWSVAGEDEEIDDLPPQQDVNGFFVWLRLPPPRSLRSSFRRPRN